MRYSTAAIVVATLTATVTPALGYPWWYPNEPPCYYGPCHGPCCEYPHGPCWWYQQGNSTSTSATQTTTVTPTVTPNTSTTSYTTSEPGSVTYNPTTYTETPVNPVPANLKPNDLREVVSGVRSLAYASWPLLSLLGLLVVPALIRR
ncbi:hypothetical protein [Methanopyrus sp.]